MEYLPHHESGFIYPKLGIILYDLIINDECEDKVVTLAAILGDHEEALISHSGQFHSILQAPLMIGEIRVKSGDHRLQILQLQSTIMFLCLCGRQKGTPNQAQQ